MLDKAILNDFLNHFYTPNQLAIFLNIPLEEVERVLNDEKLIISILGKNGVMKVRKHLDRIDTWLYSSSAKKYNIDSEQDEYIVEVANYIIINKSSIRKTAIHFCLSKSTVYDMVEEKLPSISIILYKKVFDVIKGNKSLSINESLSKIDLVNYEYDLLEKGYTIKEIAEMLELSYDCVQRDLADRLITFDGTLGKKVKRTLFEHQLTPLVGNQFDNKKLSQFMSYEELANYEYELLEKGYSIKQIAEELGISYSKVQRDLTGIRSFNPELGKKVKVLLSAHQLRGRACKVESDK